MNPLISVITRTKNRPLLLKRAIESVRSQTYDAIEHVIVNDGGDARQVRDLLSESRYEDCVVINNAQSVGMEAASNLGISQARGDYLVIHDDDDSWEPSFLEETVRFLKEQPEALGVEGVVSLSHLIIERLGDDFVETISISQYNGGGGMLQISKMAYVNQYPPISFLFSRHACDTLNGFNQHLPVLGDWDFYLRFLARFNIAVLPKYLANYHQRPSSNGIYGNTVIAQKPIHLIYDNFLRNQYARNPEIIGHIPSLLVNLALSNEHKAEKKNKDLDVLTKACMSVLNDKPDTIYIFGASDYGIYCKGLLGDHVKVVGFLDNFNVGSSMIEGCPVLKPESILDMPKINVLISSVGNREVISEQLTQLIPNNKLTIY